MAAALFNGSIGSIANTNNGGGNKKDQDKTSEISIPEHKAIRTFNERSLYPVLSANRLLAAPIRQRFLREAKEAVSLPEEYYAALYQELVNAFASCVQILPVNNEARISSLLDEGLVRADYALQYYLKDQKGEVDPLLCYVMFSAGLLFDVGCVIEDRTVIVSKNDGTFIRIWDPYHEVAMPEGAYYKIRHSGGTLPWSSRRSAVALACELMPKVGFDWIYKNPQLFNTWIALLVDDKEGAGGLRNYFDRAREALEVFKNSDEFIAADMDIEEIEAEETKNAEKFIEWLKKEIKNNKITPNTARSEIVHVASNKVLFKKSLFDRYAASTKGAVSPQRLISELGKVGFISGGPVSFGQKRPGAQAQGQSLFSGRAMFTGEGGAASKSAGTQSAPLRAEQVLQIGAVATYGYLGGGVFQGLLRPPSAEVVAHARAVAGLTQSDQLPSLEKPATPAAQPTSQPDPHPLVVRK